MKKEPKIFIQHVLERIERIERFSVGLSKETFIEDELKNSAIIRQPEIIGEAVKNLPLAFTEKYPLVSWKEIAGTRDKIIHRYFGVDLKVVWRILEKDLPILKEQIQKIKKELEHGI